MGREVWVFLETNHARNLGISLGRVNPAGECVALRQLIRKLHQSRLALIALRVNWADETCIVEVGHGTLGICL